LNFLKLGFCTIALGALFMTADSGAEEPAMIGVCAACHGVDGTGNGFAYVPIIAGTPATHLEEALFAYQDGARRCVGVPVMCDAIAQLNEAEIVELAAYYSKMPRASSKEEFDQRLAGVGKLIHDEHCGLCHVLPDDENVADALGIPLHGQRSAYLRLALGAYLTGDRETLVPIMADKLRQLDPDKIEALINYYASYNP